MAQSRQKAVLVLYPGGPYTPAATLGDQNFKRTLDERVGSVDYYREYLDFNRFTSPRYEDSVRTFLQAKYQGLPFDLIVATTDAALGFVLRSRDALFPGVPLIFGTSTDPGPIPNATGVITGLDFRPTLNSALLLQPDTTRITVVSGAGEADKFYLKLGQEQFAPLESRFTFDYLVGLPLADLKRQVASLPEHTVIFVLSFTQDTAGQMFLPEEVFTHLRTAANTPVYTWHDSGMGYGTVGGRMVSTAEGLRQLAGLSVRVLSGEAVTSIPVSAVDWRVNAYDWRELRRWSISESRIPAGSTILFRQPNLWDEYRTYILGGAALVVTQTALIGGLLLQRRRRQRTERSLRESEERFRLMADTAPVLVWRSGVDQRHDYFNRPWLEFTGRTLEQALDGGWKDGIWHEDLSRCLQTYATAVAARHPFRIEYRRRCADGTYRWVLDSGVARFAPDGTFAGYIGSCIDISDQKETEDALRTRDREIHDLAGHLIEAQDTERARIARDLHDDVSQQLAGLSISLSALKRRLGSSAAATDLQADVSALQQRTIVLAEDVRNLSHDLHPDVLRHLGLAAALDAYCSEIQRQHGLTLALEVEGDIESVDTVTAVCLYRVAQEALRNVVKHARAVHARVRLVRSSDYLELLVEDDGQGFDVAVARAAGKGLGLVSLNERVRLAGGTVSILTETSKGTRVRVRIPCQPDSMETHTHERKRAERETAELTEQLRSLNADLEERVASRTRELTDALKEREILLQEVHHRVKNNLQVISNLLNLQAQTLEAGTSRDAVEECQARVLTIALIHEKLYQTRDFTKLQFSDYARGLAQNVFHAVGVSPSAISLETAFDDVILTVDRAIPVGLVLNELITNALKHGFANLKTGTVRVKLAQVGNGKARLAVRDNGNGLPAGFDITTSDTLGLKLVRTLTEQLDGILEVDGRAGAVFQLTFPIED